MKQWHRLPNAFLFACCLLTVQASAQQIVRETAAQWKNAKPLTLTPLGKWCGTLDEEGCDFKSIDNATLLPDGGVVASAVSGPMWHFGPNGKVIGALSTKGKGPGEYGFIVQPQLVGDQLVWFDNTQMRITSVNLKNVPGRVTPTMLPMTTGMMYMVADTLVVLDVPASEDTSAMVDAVYRTVPRAGTPRVLARVKMRAMFHPGSNMTRPGAPFRSRVVADVGGDGTVAHSNGDRYVVDVFPPSGSAWRLESTAPSRAVTQADRDSVVAQTLKAFRASDLAALPPQVRAGLEARVSTFPPLSVIRVLRDGTLWIRPVSMPGESTARWDVFGRDGKRLGQVRLPAAARVRDGTKDWVLVVQLDSDDIPTLIKYGVR